MLSAWPVFLFGAPGGLFALVCCAFGLRRERAGWLVIGGMAFVPMSIYLWGNTGLAIFLMLPAMPVLATLSMRRRNRRVTFLLLTPNALAVAWMCAITLKNMMTIAARWA